MANSNSSTPSESSKKSSINNKMDNQKDVQVQDVADKAVIDADVSKEKTSTSSKVKKIKAVQEQDAADKAVIDADVSKEKASANNKVKKTKAVQEQVIPANDVVVLDSNSPDLSESEEQALTIAKVKKTKPAPIQDETVTDVMVLDSKSFASAEFKAKGDKVKKAKDTQAQAVPANDVVAIDSKNSKSFVKTEFKEQSSEVDKVKAPKDIVAKGAGLASFDSFNLPESLLKALAKLSMSKPTNVQVEAIPYALSGKDVIVSAPTGTGKTLAFSIPVVAKMIENKNFGVIVITPTRELATQIITVMQSLLSFNREVKSALLIGGAPMGPQLAQLRAYPQLIVGTPGRINDHLDGGRLKLDNTKFVVLDEMDRMLDMGFSIQIDEVLTYIKQEKQGMMLSATISPAIRKLAAKYLNNPETVTIDGKEIVNTSIKQEFIHIPREQKYEELVKQLTARDGTAIIFVKTRRNAEELSDRLYNDNFRAKAIHGDLRQNQRDKIIRLLRRGDFDVIVATDVASRGLDVPHIKHVINYNLPTNPEDYVHRVGRTGRAGEEGHALTFVSSNERKEWNALEVFLDPSKKSSQSNDGQNRSKKKFGSRDGGRGYSSDSRGNSSRGDSSSRGGYRGDSSRSDSRGDSAPRGAYQGNSPRSDSRGDSAPRSSYRGDSSRGDFAPRGAYQGNSDRGGDNRGNTSAPRSSYRGDSPRGDSAPRGGYQGNSPRSDSRGDSAPRSSYRGDSPRGDSASRSSYRGDSPRGDSASRGGYQGNSDNRGNSSGNDNRSALRGGDRRPSSSAPRRETRDPRDPRNSRVS